ncbi:hypothetical protein Dip510_002123 [Elusimicrobium posterum]|uniref:hypothetical protein n=1 Tax=Elusimicrobium posterum TaxID=3116653 RepID=UPI003C7384A7
MKKTSVLIIALFILASGVCFAQTQGVTLIKEHTPQIRAQFNIKDGKISLKSLAPQTKNKTKIMVFENKQEVINLVAHQKDAGFPMQVLKDMGNLVTSNKSEADKVPFLTDGAMFNYRSNGISFKTGESLHLYDSKTATFAVVLVAIEGHPLSYSTLRAVLLPEAYKMQLEYGDILVDKNFNPVYVYYSPETPSHAYLLRSKESYTLCPGLYSEYAAKEKKRLAEQFEIYKGALSGKYHLKAEELEYLEVKFDNYKAR